MEEDSISVFTWIRRVGCSQLSPFEKKSPALRAGLWIKHIIIEDKVSYIDPSTDASLKHPQIEAIGCGHPLWTGRILEKGLEEEMRIPGKIRGYETVKY